MASEFDLGGIVPWGRTASEYEAFFALADVPANARILDCGGGPASFAAEWARRGHAVTAIDPIYARTPNEIAVAFEDTAARMLQGMRNAYDRFKWDFYELPERVVELRRGALTAFIEDFDSAGGAARYVAGRLPELPFQADTFELVLCSHLLFLYSDEIDREMHVKCIRELLRVGCEVRLFPLLDMHGEQSSHLEPVIDRIRADVDCEIVPVDFEFQCGGSRMLRLTRAP